MRFLTVRVPAAGEPGRAGAAALVRHLQRGRHTQVNHDKLELQLPELDYRSLLLFALFYLK